MFIVLMSPQSQEYRLYLKDSRIARDPEATNCGTNESSNALRFECSREAAKVASKIPFFEEASVVDINDPSWAASLHARIELRQFRLRVLKVNCEIEIAVATEELDRLMQLDLQECLKNR